MPHAPQDLFTPEEHRVLANWFDVHPPIPARRLSLRAAMTAVNAGSYIDGPRDDPAGAAVAHILQGAPDRWLPRWQATYGQTAPSTAEPGLAVSPGRDSALRPQHLVTAAWPGRRNGSTISISYYLTWVPGYERCVVSRAVSATRRTGDAALGYFGIDVPLLEGLRDILLADWDQLAQDGVGRWNSIRSTGQLTFQLIDGWADLIWPATDGERHSSDWDALHRGSDHARAMGAHGVTRA